MSYYGRESRTILENDVLFPSPKALYDAAENSPADFGNHGRSVVGPFSPVEWYGTRTLDEALKLAREGWPEGTIIATKWAERMAADCVHTLSRDTIIHEVTGDCLDMGRFVEDIPEHWMEWDTEDISGERQSEKGPVTIVVNNGARAGASGEVLIRKGASIMAIALIMQSIGRPVRIVVGTRESSGIQHLTVFKDFYDDLQIDQCAFAIMHPASHRRINFAIRRCMGLYGAGGSVDLMADKGDIYIGHASEDMSVWGSVESSEKWVREQLRLQGVHFIGDTPK